MASDIKQDKDWIFGLKGPVVFRFCRSCRAFAGWYKHPRSERGGKDGGDMPGLTDTFSIAFVTISVTVKIEASGKSEET